MTADDLRGLWGASQREASLAGGAARGPDGGVLGFDHADAPIMFHENAAPGAASLALGRRIGRMTLANDDELSKRQNEPGAAAPTLLNLPDVPRRVVAMIASPLEPECADRVAAAFPARVELIYRPDLLPARRYVADHKGDPAWRRSPAEQAEWRALLSRAEVLWDFPVGESTPLLELAPRLRWLQATSAGVGPLVRQLGLTDSDVLVTTASGVHAGPLAEFVFTVLLHYTKQVPHLEAQRSDRRWERFCTSELRGQTLAIIGPGRVGREVARIGRCFGMTTWAHARRNDPARADALHADRLFERHELHAMLGGADCVVLCVPQTAETEGLMGREEIAALKPGVVLINIARGAVVDEDAMIAALRDGRIGFAGLDVFRAEPLPPDSPLWDLPNVMINPHSASTADTENAKLTARFIANLGHYLAGDHDRMEARLDKERGY